MSLKFSKKFSTKLQLTTKSKIHQIAGVLTKLFPLLMTFKQHHKVQQLTFLLFNLRQFLISAKYFSEQLNVATWQKKLSVEKFTS